MYIHILKNSEMRIVVYTRNFIDEINLNLPLFFKNASFDYHINNITLNIHFDGKREKIKKSSPTIVVRGSTDKKVIVFVYYLRKELFIRIVENP